MKFRSLLLVDDDADDRFIFMEALMEVDPQLICLTATNGVDALQKLDEIIPDIIFLDMNMPKMNGKECLKEIKQRPELNSVPVIMYSTSRSREHIAETKELGADHYIVKPLTMQDLKKELSLVLSGDKNQYSSLYN